MIYFSEIYNKKVFTQEGNLLGRLTDVLFLPVETPLLTKIVVDGKQNHIIPIHSVRKFNGKGIYLNDFTDDEQKENEISLSKNLQNQQIVDLKGSKIIRVNDVVINTTPQYAVSGIDIGFRGILRWLFFGRMFEDFVRNLPLTKSSEFIPWSEIQPKELQNGRIVLRKAQEQLKKMFPEDLADDLEKTTITNALNILKVMDKEMSAKVIADLKLNYQEEVLNRFPAEKSAEILSLIDPDEAVDVLLALNSKKKNEILSKMKKDVRTDLEQLLSHAKTPVGHLMTSDFLAVNSDKTVKDAIEAVKKVADDFSEIFYIYVKNKQDQLVGVINLSELLTQKPDTQLFRIMNQNLVLGRLTTPKEIVANKLLKYHLYAMPIVNENKTLLGIVSLQDISEDLLKEHSS
jgi:CBS domain-containing protein/sporulation protein YlmC with PRC-barrel domain